MRKCLGFDVIQVSPVSLGIRKGSEHSYAVVETGQPQHYGGD